MPAIAATERPYPIAATERPYPIAATERPNLMTEPTAIVIAPKGTEGALQGLIERLLANAVQVSIVEEISTAASIAAQTPAAPPCVLVDLRELAAGGDVEDQHVATAMLRRTVSAIPLALPIAVTGQADSALIVACIRAGAGDVIDITLEGTAGARAVVQRVWNRQVWNARHVVEAANLRAMIEDLLKDLIRTERRSIDLEEKLAAAERSGLDVLGSIRGRGTDQVGAFSDLRQPAILLVDGDREIANQLAERLEAAQVSTFAYMSGEDALREAKGLLDGMTGFDLALVAAQLPGIDGIETIQRLRELISGLPAFLVTSVHDADLAARAADLGVVGFVHKPLPDMAEMVVRLAQLARESLHRTREHTYLERIKARHERVLARYRSLPREA